MHPPTTRRSKGIAALQQGRPIPKALVDAAIRTCDWESITAWLAHGALDPRLDACCDRITDAQIATVVRAGVLPDVLIDRIVSQWSSNDLPWDAFPLILWDRVTDPTIAHLGRARTAATQLIHHHDLHDDRLITAAAQHAWMAAKILVARPDLREEYLITAAARNRWTAHDVLRQCPDPYGHPRFGMRHRKR